MSITRRLVGPGASSLFSQRENSPQGGGEVFYAESLFQYYCNKDYAKLLPNSAEVANLRGRLERRLGRWAAAIESFKRSLELNPRDVRNRAILAGSYLRFRHYDEANEVSDRAIAEVPDEADQFHLLKAEIAQRMGDTRRAWEELDAVSPGSFDVLMQRFEIALAEGKYDEALKWRKERDRWFHSEDEVSDQAFGYALIARARGDVAEAQKNFAVSLPYYENKVKVAPDNWNAVSQLAMVYAGLGRRDDALREANLVEQQLSHLAAMEIDFDWRRRRSASLPAQGRSGFAG